jgi:hypothetical protein
MAGLVVVALLVQAVLGWLLGLAGAWATVLVAALLIGVLATADASLTDHGHGSDSGYDPILVGLTAVAIVAAVACLYLPLPWGGLAATAILIGLITSLRLTQHRH